MTPFGVLDVAGFNQPYGLMLRDLNWDGENDQGLASILRADGTLVQAGKIPFGADYDFVITGLEADGTQDLSAFAPPNGFNPIEMGSSTHAATSIVELPSGRLVRSMRMTNANGLAIPVDDLQPGRYLLRCADDRTVRVISFHVAR